MGIKLDHTDVKNISGVSPLCPDYFEIFCFLKSDVIFFVFSLFFLFLTFFFYVFSLFTFSFTHLCNYYYFLISMEKHL